VSASFWSSLKLELAHSYRFATRADAKAAITPWIKRYNTVRLHSMLGYVPPVEWKIRYRRTQLQAAQPHVRLAGESKTTEKLLRFETSALLYRDGRGS
jgi:hypothetical protein